MKLSTKHSLVFCYNAFVASGLKKDEKGDGFPLSMGLGRETNVNFSQSQD